MFGDIGPGEVILILVVLIVVFGPKRIPDLAGSLGKGVRQFRRSLQGLEDETPAAPQAQDQPPALAPPVQAAAVPPVAAETPAPAPMAESQSFETAAPLAEEASASPAASEAAAPSDPVDGATDVATDETAPAPARGAAPDGPGGTA